MEPTNQDKGWDYISHHSFRFEPPDIVYARPQGVVTLEEAHAIATLVNTYPAPSSGLYLLTDVSRLKGQSQTALKDEKLTESMRVFRALAYFGATFQARTLINIFLRLARFFKLPVANVPLEIFATENEARAWLDERRAKASVTTS